MKMTAKSGVATAAATMFLAGVAMTPVAYAKSAKGHCQGANACKGQGACKVQNACKGQGFTMSSKSACGKAGGEFSKG